MAEGTRRNPFLVISSDEMESSNEESDEAIIERITMSLNNLDSPVKKEQLFSKDNSNSPKYKKARKELFLYPKLYHNNDKHVPVFEELQSLSNITKKDKEAAIDRIVKILVTEPPHPSFVCTKTPSYVKDNKSFLVDTTKLQNVKDLLSDDCGSWTNNGQHKFYYEETPEGYAKMGKDVDMAGNCNNYITVNRIYYYNKNAKDFRRTITFITGSDSERLPLTLLEYQFEGNVHPFVRAPHGNSQNNSSVPYTRTQKTTLENIKVELSVNHPRKAVDKVAEKVGGLMKGTSASAWPRNLTQAYNLGKSVRTTSAASSDDPYISLVMRCKDQQKTPETAFVQKVICAPEPIVLLMTNQQLNDIIKFCTNKVNFGVFQADPTFNLGPFSVTTTQYEHLLLLHRRSVQHPVMVGPMMIHQKKEQSTYKVLVDYIFERKPEFRNLCALGTDGELALSNAFLQVCPDVKHLLCFNHFANNIKHHLQSVGVDETNRRAILADIFGQQVGTVLEEGIVDADDHDEFDVRVSSLESVWIRRIGEKGKGLFDWFVKNKVQLLKNHLLKSVRIEAGLGNPPRRYVTNRVECVNSLLKREVNGKESKVDEFVATMQDMIERQNRNISWAIIDKGPYKLHPSLNHFTLPPEVWLSMSDEDKEIYKISVLGTDVAETVLPLSCEKGSLQCTEEPNSDIFSPLDLLASAALDRVTHDDVGCSTSATQNDRITNEQLKELEVLETTKDARSREVSGNDKMGMTFTEFKRFLPTKSEETIKGIWSKAIQLVTTPGQMVTAPGCHPSSRMVASRSVKDRPHLVTKGKATGEYKCEKNCPHWNGIKICSHTVAAAKSNEELVQFLTWFKSKRSSKGANLTAVVHTDMPKNPGRKGGVPATRRATPKLAIEERRKRVYSPPAQTPNTNPFFVKKVNNRIKVCQGCRGSLRSSSGRIPEPPFDYCIARKERRQYKDKTGKMCTPTRETDAHYHLRLACVKAEDESFTSSFLVIPDELSLSPGHISFIETEFGLKFNSS